MTLLFKTLFAVNNMDRVIYRLNAVNHEFCYEKKMGAPRYLCSHPTFPT